MIVCRGALVLRKVRVRDMLASVSLGILPPCKEPRDEEPAAKVNAATTGRRGRAALSEQAADRETYVALVRDTFRSA